MNDSLKQFLVTIRTWRYKKNTLAYWNLRYKLRLKSDEEGLVQVVSPQLDSRRANLMSLMNSYKCSDILEVGCGYALMRDLPNYVGLDYSREVLKRDGVGNGNLILADMSKGLPFRKGAFDSIFSSGFLLHVPYSNIDFVVEEIMRVPKKLIILLEPIYDAEDKPRKPHCFNHNLEDLFKNSKVPVVMNNFLVKS